MGVFEEKELVREIGGNGCYHARCLRCSQCYAKLQDGDSMGLGPSGAVLCKRHALRSTCVEVSCLSLLGCVLVFLFMNLGREDWEGDRMRERYLQFGHMCLFVKNLLIFF